jgi:hypothetical protein
MSSCGFLFAKLRFAFALIHAILNTPAVAATRCTWCFERSTMSPITQPATAANVPAAITPLAASTLAVNPVQVSFGAAAIEAEVQALARRQRFISDVHWDTESKVRRLCPYPLDQASPDDLVHGYSLLDMLPRAAPRLERNRLLQLHLERCTLGIASLHNPFTLSMSRTLVQQTEAALSICSGKLQALLGLLEAVQEVSGTLLKAMAFTAANLELGLDSVALPLSAPLRKAFLQADITLPAQASPVEALVLVGQRWEQLELQITELSLDKLRQSLEIQRLKHYEHIAGYLAQEALALLATEKDSLSEADPHPAKHDLLACSEAPYLSRWPDPLGLVVANGKLVKPGQRA